MIILFEDLNNRSVGPVGPVAPVEGPVGPVGPVGPIIKQLHGILNFSQKLLLLNIFSPFKSNICILIYKNNYKCIKKVILIKILTYYHNL